MNIGAWNLRQASSFNSSAVMGPVVSWEPTVVILGSQAVPGRMPATPQAAPTIFWAREKACLALGLGLTGRVKTVVGFRPRALRALSVTARPMISGMRPPARNSSATVLGLMVNLERTFFPFSSVMTPFLVSITITSPVFIPVTSALRGSAPESWAVLKNMGAMTPPMITPAVFLFGTQGISSPIAQRTELHADLREEPVPTTSPTNATWNPSLRNLAMVARPSLKRVLPMASECSGMSGRLQASPAGEKSSVLISPSTLYTLTLIVSGTPLRLVNHWASAQDLRTLAAAAFLALASAATSSKASYTRVMPDSAHAASSASFLSFKAATSGATL